MSLVTHFAFLSINIFINILQSWLNLPEEEGKVATVYLSCSFCHTFPLRLQDSVVLPVHLAKHPVQEILWSREKAPVLAAGTGG